MKSKQTKRKEAIARGMVHSALSTTEKIKKAEKRQGNSLRELTKLRAILQNEK